MYTVIARWVRLFRNGGDAHLSHACVSMSSCPNRPNCSQLGFSLIRVHPQAPLQGAFLLTASLRSSVYRSQFPSKPLLRWICVGLWVLTACAGRSTRSGFQQTACPSSHPVRVARSVNVYPDKLPTHLDWHLALPPHPEGQPNNTPMIVGSESIFTS